MAPDTPTARHVAAIYNRWYMVRHYARGKFQRPDSPAAKQRAAAIAALGRTVRRAFNESEDFEALLVAVVDGGAPRDDWPRF